MRQRRRRQTGTRLMVLYPNKEKAKKGFRSAQRDGACPQKAGWHAKAAAHAKAEN